MKKILFIALLFFGVYANAQKVKAEVIELDTLTTTERNALTVPSGKVQVVYDETIGDFYVNVKNGGWVTLASLVGGISNLVEDTTPQLGGDLDAQSRNITSVLGYTGTGLMDIGALGFAFGVNNGVSGQRWYVDTNVSNDIIFNFQSTPTTSNTTYDTTPYTLNSTGTPSAATDLIDKAYADSNYGGGASLPVDDTTSLVQDPVDGTKEMRIDVGAVSTATTRTLTMPDADVNLGALTGTSNITDFSIGANDLAPNSVTTSKISPSGSTAGLQVLRVNSGQTATEWATITTTDDQTASEVPNTPSGGIAATNVQAAINELDSEKISSDITGYGAGVTATDNIVVWDYDVSSTEPTAGTNDVVIGVNVPKIEVIPTATWDTNNGAVTLTGEQGVDDRTIDEPTITLSGAKPGYSLLVWINRASAPTLAGTGLTFNPLPNTTAFAAATEMALYLEVGLDGTTIDYFYYER